MSETHRQSKAFSGLVMAGGESSRFGQDKAVLLWEGEPLWQRQWRTLRVVGARDVMIARGEKPWEEMPGLRRIADAQPNCGPLGGLVAGLREMRHDWLLVLAVDLPLMTPEFLGELIRDSFRCRKGFIPYPGPTYQPLAAIYPRACLPVAEAALAAGLLSLQDFSRACVKAGFVCRYGMVEEDKILFANLNTPEDWERASRSARPA